MRYPANVKDISYCYDGSYPGFLCCIFESFSKKEIPAAVLPPEEGQLNLFGSREIVTDTALARRVAAGLERLGPLVMDRVTKGFLSTEPGKDLVLLRFARLCFERGPGAANMLGDADVAAAYAIERAVGNEAYRLIEFIRFEERGNMLGAVIHPKYRVLPLLRAHFTSRLPDENFMIYDANHGMALVRQNGEVQYLAMERWNPAAQDEELDWQQLWKCFFKALTIEERRNPKCQMNHAPKRYWPDMCEMQADLPRERYTPGTNSPLRRMPSSPSNPKEQVGKSEQKTPLQSGGGGLLVVY